MANGNEMTRQDKWQMEAQKRQNNLRTVKTLLAGNAVKERFNAILGKKSAQFCASLVNVVSSSVKLLECDPNSIMAAAFVAATYDLPIDSNLGFSAIVPYKNKAQFQMMTKGFVQLAIRSHEYEKMNCSEVYGDELVSYNPITGECQFVTDFSRCTQRANGKEEDIAGYYAWFRLLHGYTAELYMSREEVIRHARKYSRAYQYDMRSGAKSSVWSTDFTAMAKKTVLKRLLNRWGILSVDIQRAIEDDQKVYEASGNGEYADSQNEIIIAEDPFTTEDQDAEIAEAADAKEDETPELHESDEQPAPAGSTSESTETESEEEEPEEIDITKM